jgi:hypothetical protein
MKLIGTIKSIVKENKDKSIPNMIKTLGISDAIKYFGNYYKIEPYLKEVDKVNFIKDTVNEFGEGYIDLYEISEEPIIYEEEEGEIHQIESLGNASVNIRAYQDMGNILYDYYVKYESLPSHIIELLVEILLNH